MKRTPLRRRKRPIRRMSASRIVRHAQYHIQAVEYLRVNKCCQGCMDHRATEVHHTAGRVGDRLLDESTWMALCHPCHLLVHREPAWALERGYLVRRA